MSAAVAQRKDKNLFMSLPPLEDEGTIIGPFSRRRQWRRRALSCPGPPRLVREHGAERGLDRLMLGKRAVGRRVQDHARQGWLTPFRNAFTLRPPRSPASRSFGHGWASYSLLGLSSWVSAGTSRVTCQTSTNFLGEDKDED